MAHYAFLDNNNIVTEVIVGIDETELIEGLEPEVWYGNFRGQSCKRTSYNNKIRKQFAGVGFRYDSTSDVFIAPKPYDSWVLDDNLDWKAPIDLPDTTPFKWLWNEDLGTWIERKTM